MAARSYVNRLTESLRGAEVIFEVGAAAVLGPIERRAVVDGVFEIETSGLGDEQEDDFGMTIQRGLVQGRGMGVEAGRVVAVWIFAGIEEEFYDFRVTVLGGESECGLAIKRGGEWKKAGGVR